jgi:hypothetical protein
LKPISELCKIHSSPIAILGGSPSLPNDVALLPTGCILMAANHHAHLLGIETDYLVFKDDPKKRKNLVPAIAAHRGEIISKLEPYTDYQINVKIYDRGFTGMFCLGLASYMTSAEVILCGMDCYSGDTPYFHDQVFNKGAPLSAYLASWQLAWGKVKHIQGCENPERISAPSGPLTRIFKKYEPNGL